MHIINNRSIIMNFTPELTAFQGALVTADEVHRFMKISSRGGNENRIKEIVNMVYTFLKDNQYVTNEDEKKAKNVLKRFTFYLVLNTDLIILDDLAEMPGIERVVNTIPVLSKVLMCELIWGLQLDPFVYDVLVFSNPQLSVQALSPLIDSIKCFSPSESLPKIKLLAEACYRIITRLFLFQFNAKVLQELFECFLRCINFYETSPNIDTLNNLSTDDNYKFLGNKIYSFVSLINHCFALYSSPVTLESEGYDEIFLSTIDPNNIKRQKLTQKIHEIINVPTSVYLDKCNKALLDKCMNVIMEINLDIFCAWSEFEENGKSMQNTVGEQCYLLYVKLERSFDTSQTISDHPILNMLKEFSCKPTDIWDIMRATEESAIIDCVNEADEEKNEWLKFIIQREDICWNQEYIDCIQVHLEFVAYNDENNTTLFKKIVNYLKNNPEGNNTDITEIASKLFIEGSLEVREELLNYHFDNKTFNNLLETKDLPNLTVEIFNKLVTDDDEDEHLICNVFIQNPFKTYTAMINTAIQNDKQCDIMVKAMLMLDNFSDHYYLSDVDACIYKTILNFPLDNIETGAHRNNYVNFLIQLKKTEIINPTKLLFLIIMPKLTEALKSKDYDMIDIQVKLLDGSFEPEELVPYRAPLLTMIGYVLEIVRWQAQSFSPKAPAILERTLQLQMKVLHLYGEIIPAKDYHWLRSKNRNLSPLNMYYYRMIWSPPGKNFIEITSGMTNIAEDILVVYLARIIYMTTIREWHIIWESINDTKVNTLIKFCEAHRIMTSMETIHRTGNTRGCTFYCLRNLVIIIKEKFNSDPLSKLDVVFILGKLVDVINTHHPNDIEDVITVVMPLLSYIAEKREKNYEIVNDELLSMIKHEMFSNVIKQIFLNVNL